MKIMREKHGLIMLWRNLLNLYMSPGRPDRITEFINGIKKQFEVFLKRAQEIGTMRTIVVIILSAVCIRTSGAQSAGTIDAQALVRQVETQYQGATSHSTMHMKVITDVYTREMTLEGWSEGRDKFLAADRPERNPLV